MKLKIIGACWLVFSLFCTLSYSWAVSEDAWIPPPKMTTARELAIQLEPLAIDPSLPLPCDSVIPTKTLTLSEAIFLALRDSPNVKSNEIQRIVDKYQVILAKQVFRPEYRFSALAVFQHGESPTYTLTPNVTLLTHSGSQFGVNYANGPNGIVGATTISWTQPLIKGLGAVNTVPLYNALTNEEIAKLSFENNIISAITTVISAYRRLAQDYNNIDIQKRFLKDSKLALQQYKLRVKTGKMARSDIYQQEATYASTQLSFVQQQNSVQQDYQSLLSAIGLLPDAKINIIKKINISRFPLPTQEVAIQRALDGNISYQQSLLRLENTRRQIIVAVNARKIGLDLTLSQTLGSATTDLSNAHNVGLFTLNKGPALTVNLSIPIDNIAGKAGEVSARVALEQAKLALQKERNDLVRKVITQLDTVRSGWEQIKVSRSSVVARRATLRAAQLKLNYGRSTVFEVTQDQNALLQQETSLIGTEIAYLNDVTSLETLWGVTLESWGVELRY